MSRSGSLLELALTPVGVTQPHDAEIGGVLTARDQAAPLGPVDEADRAVGSVFCIALTRAPSNEG